MSSCRWLLQLPRQAQGCLFALHKQQQHAWIFPRPGQSLFSTGGSDEEGSKLDEASATKTAEAGTAVDQVNVEDAAPSGASDTSSRPAADDQEGMERSSAHDSETLPSDKAKEHLQDLISELDTADPILAAQAGFDLGKLKKAAEQGSIEPDILKGYIDLAKPADPDGEAGEAMTDLDFQVEGAVRDQYAQFGITTDDLRLYLQVSLDIEDAISAGRKPAIDPDRYSTYKRVDNLVKYGPEKNPEEAERLDHMAEQEIMKMPWPTPMIREYMKKKGMKMSRMNKQDITTYDKGYLTEAIFPFQYEEDFEAAITGEANKGAVRSFWHDEVNEDGTIERTAGRAVGSEDLTLWGQAVWMAMQTQARNVAAMEDQESEAAAAAAAGQEQDSEEGEEGNGGNPAVAAAEDAKAAVEAQGQALQALIIAKLGERADLAKIDADDVKQVDAEVAKAVSEAAFEEQEESILRGVGYERSQLPQFLEEVGMTKEGWQQWVQEEVTQTVSRLCTRHMDSRSPQDVFEDFIAGQRTVRPWFGVATDKRAIVESHEYGPLSDYQALPAHVTEDGALRHPAATRELVRSLVDATKASNVFPEIFRFTQTLYMHLGTKPYHPGNRRVKMHVHLRDLQLRYGLSVEALQHVVAVAGNRYNEHTGVLSLSCDRHRAREDNRRQVMHFMLNLVESALVAHPSEEWEKLKRAQESWMQHLDKEPVPEYLQYIAVEAPAPVHAP
eukprot:jgi/Ulvmu1/9290/UM050_0039.1